MKKAIIYGRVSTDKQDYSRQVNELRQYAERNGYEIVREFADIQTGKANASARRGSKEMLDYMQVAKVDIVLTSEISRLGRSAIDTQATIHKIVYELNTDLYIHQQGMKAYDKAGKINAGFKLVTDVLANVAQMEREQISERVKSGLEEAKRKGKTLGRRKGSTESSSDLLKKHRKVVRELESGLSLRKTAKLCGVSVNTVRKVKAAVEG